MDAKVLLSKEYQEFAAEVNELYTKKRELQDKFKADMLDLSQRVEDLQNEFDQRLNQQGSEPAPKLKLNPKDALPDHITASADKTKTAK